MSGAAVAWLGPSSTPPRTPRSPPQFATTIPVDELRSLLRADVQEVVRAELQASRGSRRWSGPSCASEPRRWSHEPRRCSSEQLIWASSSKQDLIEQDGDGDGLNSSPNKADQQRGDETSSYLYVLDGGFEMEPTGLHSVLEQYALLEDMPPAKSRQMGGPMSRLRHFCQVLHDSCRVEEPPRKGALADCIASSAFHIFFAVVVAANAGYMIYASNHDIQDIGKNPSPEYFRLTSIVDICFLILFTIELVCRLAVHRLFFFVNKDAAWNWLDFTLIVEGIYLLYLQSAHIAAGGRRSGGSMRLFRLLKVTRILRILRVFRFFTQLHLIFASIVGSITHLFWSTMVFVILFLIFSLYFTSSVATYLKRMGSTDSGEEQTVLLYFGSVATSARTLFMTVFSGGDWEDYYFALVPLGGPCHYVFLLLVAFLHLSLLNIVTGIFVEHALKISQPDVHQQAQERFTQEQQFAKELRFLFALADKNGDGFADKDELETMVRDGRIVNYLRFLNIDPLWSKRNLFHVFNRVADHEGQVRITTLVERIMTMRGFARSTEIVDLRGMVRTVLSLQEQMMSKIDVMGGETD